MWWPTKVQLGMDYVFQNWRSANSRVERTASGFDVAYRNTSTVKFGVEYTPNRADVRRELKRWSYRAGLRYGTFNQTYGNLEIICVDDGSPDDCGAILDDYARKDSRLKVIHQKNAGYPSAINQGLNYISGNYVGFVDPDDWVELDFFERAVEIAKNTGADIVA